MKYPHDIEGMCKRRYPANFMNWVLSGGSWPLAINLVPPTEKEAMEMLPTVKAWVDSWSEKSRPGELVWREFQWKIIGKHTLPCQLILSTPKEVAAWADLSDHWTNVTKCYDRVTQFVISPSSQLLKLILSSDDSSTGLDLLFEVVKWFNNNASSGLYLRQLPIEGVHTKWIEKNKELVLRLVCELRGISTENDFYEFLGLRPLPFLVRFRILDPEIRKVVGGFSDISVRLDELASLNLKIKQVLIIENLQTGLALNDIPETIAFLGLGNAVSVLSRLPWISESKCYYWGDIDTYGFSILDNLRSSIPSVQSLLMTEEALMRHKNLWVREEKQFPNGHLSHLTQEENEVFQGLLFNKWGDKLRLEQERINWEYAWASILRITK